MAALLTYEAKASALGRGAGSRHRLQLSLVLDLGRDVYPVFLRVGHEEVPIGLVFNHSRRASFIRVCQPLPDARKGSTTSGDKRMVTGSFVTDDFGRPPRFTGDSSLMG
ncbi:hypothetical protein D3C86_1802070 [compost metagenome]